MSMDPHSSDTLTPEQARAAVEAGNPPELVGLFDDGEPNGNAVGKQIKKQVASVSKKAA